MGTATTTAKANRTEVDGILQHICMCMSDEEDEQAGYLVRGAFSEVVVEIETLRLASCAPGNTIGHFAHWPVSNGEVVAVDFGASVSIHLCVNGDYNGGNVASPVLRAWWEMLGCYFGERANWDNESMIQGYLPDGVCVDLGDSDE